MLSDKPAWPTQVRHSGANHHRGTSSVTRYLSVFTFRQQPSLLTPPPPLVCLSQAQVSYCSALRRTPHLTYRLFAAWLLGSFKLGTYWYVTGCEGWEGEEACTDVSSTAWHLLSNKYLLCGLLALNPPLLCLGHRTMYTWLPGFLTKEMHQGIAKCFAWVLTAQVGC